MVPDPVGLSFVRRGGARKSVVLTSALPSAGKASWLRNPPPWVSPLLLSSISSLKESRASSWVKVKTTWWTVGVWTSSLQGKKSSGGSGRGSRLYSAEWYNFLCKSRVGVLIGHSCQLGRNVMGSGLGLQFSFTKTGIKCGWNCGRQCPVFISFSESLVQSPVSSRRNCSLES